MVVQHFLTDITCNTCGMAFLRVPQAIYRIAETEPDASIVCTVCRAVGRYEEVIKQGAGLRGNVLTEEQCAEIIEKLRVAPSGL